MTTVARQPSPRLRPYIARYAGYRFDDGPASGHAGLPSRHLTLVVSLGGKIGVSGLAGAGSYQTLVAGCMRPRPGSRDPQGRSACGSC